MSLDYPVYAELKKKKSSGATWWRIGDCMYYIGLLGTLFCIILLPIFLITGLLGKGWSSLGLTALLIPVFILTFCLGSIFKGFAHQKAKKLGIPDA